MQRTPTPVREQVRGIQTRFMIGKLFRSLTCIRPRAPVILGMALLCMFAAGARAEPVIVPADPGGEIVLDLPGSQTSQEYILSPGGPYISAELDVGADARDVALIGSTAFIAAGRDGLRILDTTGSSTTGPLAHLPLPDAVSLIRVQGDTALLVGARALFVVDVLDPGTPHLRAHVRIKRTPIDAVLAGTSAWLLFERELLLLDLSGAEPVVRARVGLASRATGLAVTQTQVFIAAADAGILVLDAQDPAAPGAILRTSGPAFGVAAEDGKLFVADGNAGMTVFDANAGLPRWLGSFRRIPALKRIAVNGVRALAAGGDGGLYLLDISRPAQPSLMAMIRAPGRPAAYHLGSVRAGVLDGARLSVYDLNPPPPRLGNEGLDFGQGVNLGGQRRVFIADDIAYVADWFSGLHLYDLTNPRRPSLLASFRTDGSSKGVVVRDGIAYVADDDHGLQVIDVRDPRRPARIAELPTPGLAYTPVLDGDLLYLASHRGGFVVIDVADPYTPHTLAQVDTPGKAWSLRVRDGILYVADDDSGLRVFDVRDPRAPREIGRFDPGGAAEEVLLDGDRAYAAFFDRGIYVLDISDPAAPAELGHVATPGNARGLDRRGKLLYVADWLAGVQVIDVSDPRAPRITGGYDTDGAAWGVQLHGRHAYVMDWWGGISVLDIAHAPVLRRAGGYPRRDAVRAVALHDRHAFVAQGDAGVQAFDIENPLNPIWMAGVDLPGATHVVTLGGRAYVLHGGRHLAELDIANPYQMRLFDDLPLAQPAHALYAAADRLLLTEERAVTLYDPAARAATRYPFADRISDAGYADGRFYLAMPGRGLVVAAPEHGRMDALTVQAVAGDLAQLRIAGAHAYLVVRGEGVRIFDLEDTAVTEVARIPIADVVDDLQIDGTTLYAVTGSSWVYAFDVADPAQWHMLNRYGTLGAATGVAARGDFLYLTGRDTLTALQTLPPLGVRVDSDGRSRIDLPADLPAGAYDLIAVDRTASKPDRVAQRAAVVVEALRFGKPKITLEQFKALMEQYNKSTAHPDAADTGRN